MPFFIVHGRTRCNPVLSHCPNRVIIIDIAHAPLKEPCHVMNTQNAVSLLLTVANNVRFMSDRIYVAGTRDNEYYAYRWVAKLCDY
jgi:hypothetical protein